MLFKKMYLKNCRKSEKKKKKNIPQKENFNRNYKFMYLKNITNLKVLKRTFNTILINQ